jgi:hypothetical protein
MAAGSGFRRARLAPARVMAGGNDIVPIPGTKRRIYMEENAWAAGIRPGPPDVARLDADVPRGATAGARYPDMSTVNR